MSVIILPQENITEGKGATSGINQALPNLWTGLPIELSEHPFDLLMQLLNLSKHRVAGEDKLKTRHASSVLPHRAGSVHPRSEPRIMKIWVFPERLLFLVLKLIELTRTESGFNISSGSQTWNIKL